MSFNTTWPKAGGRNTHIKLDTPGMPRKPRDHQDALKDPAQARRFARKKGEQPGLTAQPKDTPACVGSKKSSVRTTADEDGIPKIFE